jgi:hypothetical protein
MGKDTVSIIKGRSWRREIANASGFGGGGRRQGGVLSVVHHGVCHVEEVRM